MTHILTDKKNRETWLSGMAALLVVALVVTLLMITGYLFAADMVVK